MINLLLLSTISSRLCWIKFYMYNFMSQPYISIFPYFFFFSIMSFLHTSIVSYKIVKNIFLTQHGTYNINSNREIIKSQVKYFNKFYFDNYSQVVNNNIKQLKIKVK